MKYWNKKGSELLEEINSTVLADGQTAMWFVGQVGFIIKARETIILIDPVFNDLCDGTGASMRYYEAPFAPDEINADYVLCTHGHIDHMAEDTLKGLVKANPEVKILVPAGCKELAKGYGLGEENLVTGVDGDEISLQEGIRVDCISTAHPVHVYDENDEAMSLAYRLQVNGKSILHLGDTYLTETLYKALKALPSPDVLMMPINGDDVFRKMDNCIGNMEAEEAARLAVDLAADLAIPMHFDMIHGNTVDPLRFAGKLREMDKSAKYYIPVLGAKYVF